MSIETQHNNYDDLNLDDSLIINEGDIDITQDIQDLEDLKQDIHRHSLSALLAKEIADYELNFGKITPEDEKYLGISKIDLEKLQNNKNRTAIEEATLSEKILLVEKLRLMKIGVNFLIKELRAGNIDIQTKDNRLKNPFHISQDDLEVHTDSSFWELIRRGWLDITYLSNEGLPGNSDEWDKNDEKYINILYNDRVDTIKELMYDKTVEDLFHKINNKQIKIETGYELNPFELSGEDIGLRSKGRDGEILDDNLVFWTGWENEWTQADVDRLNAVYQEKLDVLKVDNYKGLVQGIMKNIRINTTDVDKIKNGDKPFNSTIGYGITFFGTDIDDYLPEGMTFDDKDMVKLNETYNEIKSELMKKSVTEVIDKVKKNELKIEKRQNNQDWPFYISKNGRDIKISNYGRDQNLLDGANKWGADLGWAGNYTWGDLPFVWSNADIDKLNTQFETEFIDNAETLKEDLKNKALERLIDDALNHNYITIDRQHLSAPFSLVGTEIRIYTDSLRNVSYLNSGLSWTPKEKDELNQKYKKALDEKIKKDKSGLIEDAANRLFLDAINGDIKIDHDHLKNPFGLDDRNHQLTIYTEGFINIEDIPALQYFEGNIPWNANDRDKLNKLYREAMTKDMETVENNETKETRLINKTAERLFADAMNGSVEIDRRYLLNPFRLDNDGEIKVQTKLGFNFDSWLDKEKLDGNIAWLPKHRNQLNKKYKEKMEAEMKIKKPSLIGEAIDNLLGEVIKGNISIEDGKLLRPFRVDNSRYQIKIETALSTTDIYEESYFKGNMPWYPKDRDIMNDKYEKKFKAKIDRIKPQLIKDMSNELIRDIKNGDIQLEKSAIDKPFYIEDHVLKVHAKLDLGRVSGWMEKVGIEDTGGDKVYGDSRYYWVEGTDDKALNKEYNRNK